VSETEIKKSILDGIKAEFPTVTAFRVWCGNIQAKHGARIVGAEKGTPDICGFLPDGRFLGVEVKTKEGSFSADQYEFGTKAAKAGAVIIGAASWEDCRKKLQEEINASK